MSRQDILDGIAQTAAQVPGFMLMRVGETWVRRHVVWELRNQPVAVAYRLIADGKGIESLI